MNRAIVASVSMRLESIVGRVAQLVAIETPTGCGTGIDLLVTELEREFRIGGAKVYRHAGDHAPHGSHLIVEVPGAGVLAGDAAVLLVGHSDTVWKLGTLAIMPWSRDGDRIAGPGSFDMKSGLVVIETALAVLRELKLPHPPIRVAVAADEETGSATFAAVLQPLLDSVGCVLGFESPHPDGALKRGRWGSTRIELCVSGRESHAALDPTGGISAIDELVDQLHVIRGIVAEVNADSEGPGKVLLNVGTIEGGSRANVVAGTAKALIGLRFLDPHAETETLGRVLQLRKIRTSATVEVQVLSSRPAWVPNEATDELVSKMAAVASGLGIKLSARPAAGAADTNLPGSLGMPTLDGLGPVGEGAHARTESFSLASLQQRIVLLVGFLSS